MMQKRSFLIATVLLTVLILMAWKAMTFSVSDEPITLGVVNMQKLLSGYKTLQEDDAQFRQMVTRKQKELEFRELLEQKEWEELDLLERKEEENKLTDPERNRLDELRKLSEKRRTEMDRLRLKAQMTDEERKQLESLQNLLRANQPKLQEKAQQLQQQLAEINQRLTKAYQERLRDAAKQTAQQLKLKLIITSEEDIVLYYDQSLDVTEKMLSILNAGK